MIFISQTQKLPQIFPINVGIQAEKFLSWMSVGRGWEGGGGGVRDEDKPQGTQPLFRTRTIPEGAQRGSL